MDLSLDIPPGKPNNDEQEQVKQRRFIDNRRIRFFSKWPWDKWKFTDKVLDYLNLRNAKLKIIPRFDGPFWNLKELYIGPSCEEIAPKAFYEHKCLAHVRIERKTGVVFGEHCFAYCKKLENVLLSKQEPEIIDGTLAFADDVVEDSAFFGCCNLQVPEPDRKAEFQFVLHNRRIRESGRVVVCQSAFYRAFRKGEKLVTRRLDLVGTHQFANTGLVDINIAFLRQDNGDNPPFYLFKIPENFVSYSKLLTRVHISMSYPRKCIYTIEERAFCDCPVLEEFSIKEQKPGTPPLSANVLNYAFAGCKRLAKFPYQILEIADKSFKDTAVAQLNLAPEFSGSLLPTPTKITYTLAGDNFKIWNGTLIRIKSDQNEAAELEGTEQVKERSMIPDKLRQYLKKKVPTAVETKQISWLLCALRVLVVDNDIDFNVSDIQAKLQSLRVQVCFDYWVRQPTSKEPGEMHFRGADDKWLTRSIIAQKQLCLKKLVFFNVFTSANKTKFSNLCCIKFSTVRQKMARMVFCVFLCAQRSSNGSSTAQTPNGRNNDDKGRAEFKKPRIATGTCTQSDRLKVAQKIPVMPAEMLFCILSFFPI